jgi:hypothetical protein
MSNVRRPDRTLFIYDQYLGEFLMRREILFSAVKRVRQDIEESGFLPMLEKGVDAARRREGAKEQLPQWVSFDVFQKYSLRVGLYGEAERHVLDALNLSDLSAPAFWARLAEVEPGELFNLRSRIKFALEHLPKIRLFAYFSGIACSSVADRACRKAG